MKPLHTLFFTILFSFFTQIVFGQTNKPCNNFDCAYKKAETFLKQAAYQKALDNLDSAEGYLTDTNTKEKEQIKQLRRRLFVAIEKEKEDAKRARREAELQKTEAQKQRDIANAEKERTNEVLSFLAKSEKELKSLNQQKDSINQSLISLNKRNMAILKANKLVSDEYYKIYLNSIKEGNKRNLFLISIGINDYNGKMANLKGAVNDSKSIEEMFNSQKNKLFNNIYTYSFTDQLAVKNSVLDTLKKIIKSATNEDLILFFYSGMGDKGICYFYDYDENKQEGILKGDELISLFLKSDAFVLSIVDICRSQVFYKLLEEANQSDDVNKLKNKILAFGSSLTSESSFELYKDNKVMSFFTLSFIEAIKNGKADFDNNGVIYLDELYRFIKGNLDKELYQLGKKQTPYIGVSPNIRNIPLFQLGEKFNLPIQELDLSIETSKD